MEENEASGEYTSVQVNRRLEEENDGKASDIEVDNKIVHNNEGWWPMRIKRKWKEWREARKKNKEEKEMEDENHVPTETQAKDKEAGGTDGPGKTNDSEDITCHKKSNTKSEEHVIHVTKYGSDLLPGMKTIICNETNPTDKHRKMKVEALADSGATHSIISMHMAKKINMTIFEKGSAT